MQAKRIFILVGHPDTGTLTSHIADAYEKGALAAGHEVRRQNVAEMHFDPVLHHGYRAIQELEPDLKTFQENVKWAEHFVIIYPNWWGTMPSPLKGLIDRAWLPGFAFRFHKTGMGKGMLWDPLLSNKSARIIILANTHPLAAHFLFGDFTNELSRATLGFAGIKARITCFTPSERAPDARKQAWIERAAKMGMMGS